MHGLKWFIPIIEGPGTGFYLCFKPSAVVVAPNSARIVVISAAVPSHIRGMFGIGEYLQRATISGIVVRSIQKNIQTTNVCLDISGDPRERMKAG